LPVKQYSANARLKTIVFSAYSIELLSHPEKSKVPLKMSAKPRACLAAWIVLEVEPVWGRFNGNTSPKRSSFPSWKNAFGAAQSPITEINGSVVLPEIYTEIEEKFSSILLGTTISRGKNTTERMGQKA
jgi:hypothetical protein